ncbi:MAG: ABC transporter substrate-binding protein [Anaerolineaceae bacterium]|nr:ABC transporter substrate-binding protein [Anaerolineaceae bacterium]
MYKKTLLTLGILLLITLLSLSPLAAQEEGGTMTFAISSFDTLDIHVSGDGNAMGIAWLLGATLVARDNEVNYHPWLATSWETSEDGMLWTFHLRDDVTFHDGRSLTAEDFVWSITRLLAPETASPQSGRLRSISHAVAVDDTTLEVHMNDPFPLLLEHLSNTGVVQPYHPEFYEEAGDQFGREFVGVGPYVLEEVATGESVTLVRNPDYNWGPPFVMNQGPYHIERLEFVIIPEPSTVLAGLETGEIDYAAVQASDVAYLRTLDHLTVLEGSFQGMLPALHFNMSKAPFDDIRVRQALNHALDRQLLVDVILEGHGRPQYGPISSTIGGYWEGVEEIGYHYDPERARELLAEAGFADGLELEFKCLTPTFNTLCEVIQQLFGDVGITANIVLVDASVVFGDALAGNYDVMTLGYGASESDILYRWFHTSRMGALNPSRAADSELDRILDNTRKDIANRDMWVNEAQRHLVEQAYVAPIYRSVNFVAVNNRVQGYLENPANLATWAAFFNDATIASE